MKKIVLSKRKLAVIIAISTVLVGLVVYLVISLAYWDNYGKNWHKTYAGLVDQVNKATKIKPKNPVEYKTKLNSLKDLNDKLARESSYCTSSPLYSWQENIVEKLRFQVSDCQQSEKKIKQAQLAIKNLLDYEGSEQQIQQKLVKIVSSETESLDVESQKSYEDLVIATVGNLEKLQVSDAARPLVVESTNRLKSIAELWQKLAKADSDKNRAEWEDSAKKLYDSYSQLIDLSDKSIEIRSNLSKDIESAVSKL